MGLVVSIGVWIAADRFFTDRAHDRLELQAEALVSVIQQGAMNVESDLRAVAGLFEASEMVTAEEFQTLVERIEPAPGLAGVAYVPLVSAKQLSEFVRDAARHEPTYSVFEIDADGDEVPVSTRATHFPVRYFHPTDVADPMGLDVASVPNRLPYIQEAVDSKRIVATPLAPVAIFDQEGYVVYQPILDQEEEVAGLAVGPVLLDPLINAAVPPTLAAGLDWTILEEGDTAALTGNELSLITEATIGTQAWRLKVWPASSSSIAVDAWRPAATLASAVLALSIVAALATFWFWREAHSRTRAESLGALLSSKDRFVATVSHELRTPLAAVVGFSELLKDGGLEKMDTEERDEIINTIADQASDLASIVEDLLVIARADHGTLAAVAVPVDVAAQCRQVIERISSPSNVPIQVAPGAHTVRALADPGRVRQIIRNLLANASSYGGSDIRVAVEADDDIVSVRVSDNGQGVPPAQTERIFEAYQRAHEAGPTTGSLGLGLSVSRTLARHMGGDLRYRRAGGITTFDLQLPTAIAAGVTAKPPSTQRAL